MAFKERQINLCFSNCSYKCLWNASGLRASLSFQGHITWQFALIDSFCPHPMESWQIFLYQAKLWQWTMTRHPLMDTCDFAGPTLGVLQTRSALIISSNSVWQCTMLIMSIAHNGLWFSAQNQATVQRKSRIHSMSFRVLPVLFHLLFY